jgi:hypothetical protein
MIAKTILENASHRNALVPKHKSTFQALIFNFKIMTNIGFKVRMPGVSFIVSSQVENWPTFCHNSQWQLI